MHHCTDAHPCVYNWLMWIILKDTRMLDLMWYNLNLAQKEPVWYLIEKSISYFIHLCIKCVAIKVMCYIHPLPLPSLLWSDSDCRSMDHAHLLITKSYLWWLSTTSFCILHECVISCACRGCILIDLSPLKPYFRIIIYCWKTEHLVTSATIGFLISLKIDRALREI